MNLDIRVQPRASRNSVEIGGDGTVRVRVTTPPDRGKANDAVVKLLAKRLGISRSAVRIVRGHTSRSKVVRISGMDREDAIRLIRGA
ncbi:MAG: DUF167 domain-containing protein [Dehalococcoidia bacterium]|nr:DUF167 domain-containing protein [Dehalococcoidia bacterium]